MSDQDRLNEEIERNKYLAQMYARALDELSELRAMNLRQYHTIKELQEN